MTPGLRGLWRAVCRARWKRSFAGHVMARMDDVDGWNQAMLLGANIVLTLLPLFVLLGRMYASRRVDDDLALHMGLDDRATATVHQLFIAHTPKFGIAIVIAGAMLVFWRLSMTASLQNLYERVFHLERHGIRDAHGFVVWMVALCLSVAMVGVSVRPVLHEPAAPVLTELITFALLTPFVWWTMHFLLGGRVGPRPAPASRRNRYLYSRAGCVLEAVFLVDDRLRQQALRFDRRGVQYRHVVDRRGHDRGGRRRCRRRVARVASVRDRAQWAASAPLTAATVNPAARAIIP